MLEFQGVMKSKIGTLYGVSVILIFIVDTFKFGDKCLISTFKDIPTKRKRN